MIRVPAEVQRTFALPVSPEAAFALMRDVPAWGALFPNVARITALEEDVWQWDMKPLGPPGFEARTVYACRYVFNAETHEVTWTPEPGVGNATFAGGVRFAPEASGGGTAGTLWLDAALDIPAPRFMGGIVRPAVAFEFGRMTDQFLSRLETAVRDL